VAQCAGLTPSRTKRGCLVTSVLVENAVDHDVQPRDFPNFNSRRVVYRRCCVAANRFLCGDVTPPCTGRGFGAAAGINGRRTGLCFDSVCTAMARLYRFPTVASSFSGQPDKTRPCCRRCRFSLIRHMTWSSRRNIFAQTITLGSSASAHVPLQLQELQFEVSLRRASLEEARSNLSGASRSLVLNDRELMLSGRWRWDAVPAFVLPFERKASLADAL